MTHPEYVSNTVFDIVHASIIAPMISIILSVVAIVIAIKAGPLYMTII